MTDPSRYVRLQLLIRPESRNPRGLAEIEAGLHALGFEVTGTGLASVSARATPEAFRAAFGRAAGTGSAGSSAQDDAGLPVPDPLAARIQSITVAPRHIPIDGKA